MSRPAFLSENLLNTRQFAGHTLTASESPAATPITRIANGRRSAVDHWTPTSTATDHWWRCEFDRVRYLNGLVFDRGHNLAGYPIEFRTTLDATDFSGTYETAVDITLPSVSAPASLDETLGVRTEEGSWLLRFPGRAAKAIECFIPNMGAGLKPILVLAWAGLWYAPEYFQTPFEDDTDELVVAETVSDLGWRGRGPASRPRLGTISYRLKDVASYFQVRYHLLGHFGNGAPTWIVQDDEAADRAVLAIRPKNRLGFPIPQGAGFRQTTLEWVEHETGRRP